ncbi:MAG: aspartate kinase [Oscillospiraceae bacterium]|jgi:aspartate kinase|nr:aspartate kinase [Oscillospiraceae bacterium]
MLIVQKFGGSSVADAERIRRVAGIIAKTYQDGNDVVVVLSAQGDTTDDLIAKAELINKKASKRELDMLLSTGEQISVALCAMALEAMNIPAVSLTGWQAGIQTTRQYGNSRIREINTERIYAELDRKRVVIVCGFQGSSNNGDITTLGRGGSDTSAVALAAKLKAGLCQIFTDVEGVYTADPRIVPEAHKMKEITYDEMLELASLGAKVLHNRSVEMARKYGVRLEVLSSFTKQPGTIVKERVTVEETKISGLAKDSNISRIALVGLRDEPGVAFRVFRLLAAKNINVDIILQSIGRENSKDISFTVAKTDYEAAVNALNEEKESIGFQSLDVSTTLSKISIVGAGMINSSGVASTMFEALYEAHVNIHMISTSEIKVSVLIDEVNADAAMKAIHNKFFHN